MGLTASFAKIHLMFGCVCITSPLAVRGPSHTGVKRTHLTFQLKFLKSF